MQLHLASIVESAGDLIISTDPAGAIMTWNAAAEKATGYTHRRSARRASSPTISKNRKICEVEACFRGIAEIDDRRSVEWPMRCRGGESIPVSWRLSRMTGHQAKRPAWSSSAAIWSSSARWRRRCTRARSSRRSAWSIGGIAHEIRNPLGVSSAAAQLMQRTDRLARTARGMHRQSHRRHRPGFARRRKPAALRAAGADRGDDAGQCGRRAEERVDVRLGRGRGWNRGRMEAAARRRRRSLRRACRTCSSSSSSISSSTPFRPCRTAAG